MRDFFSKQKITVGASGLAVLISAAAVQAAPVGLAATISAAAVLAGTAVHTSTVIATTKTIAMTIFQKILISTTLAVVAGAGIYEAHQASQLQNQVQTLQQQQVPLAEQIRQLQHERDSATNRVAGLLAENEQLKSNSNQTELLRSRGEVGVLRQQLQSVKQSHESQQAGGQAITNGVEISQEDYYRLKQADIRQAFGEIILTIKVYVAEHSGAYPTNLMQLVEPHQFGSHYLHSTEFPGGIKMDDFELMNVSLLNDNNSQMLMLRGKNPRRIPEHGWADKWERYYVSACCEWLATSTDGNFDDWEKTNSASDNRQQIRNSR
jgi:hypothetical protein